MYVFPHLAGHRSGAVPGYSTVSRFIRTRAVRPAWATARGGLLNWLVAAVAAANLFFFFGGGRHPRNPRHSRPTPGERHVADLESASAFPQPAPASIRKPPATQADEQTS